ncbi:MAG: hypothetical protein HZB51_18835 [Chloroflexi bacterium]|nr:hypothetical protein [Chloroflexota bacterium]
MIFINNHEIVLDEHERLGAWASYDRVIWLAMNFIKHCPHDLRNELPWYLQYSCFWTDPLRPTIWPDNPAGKFAWAVTTLLKYYPYSGDRAFVDIVREMLDRLIVYHTPTYFDWGGVPYSSAHPGTGIYFGARADGEYATEPDKIAQVARAYVDFYELTEETRYLAAARHCANVLVAKMRAGDATHSPLPFRVDVRDGQVIEEYTADQIQAVRLFDELIRLGDFKYTSARDTVWNWLLQYPMRNGVWKGYFEDIRLDPDNANRDQLSPLETARYILQNPEHSHVSATSREAFGDEAAFASTSRIGDSFAAPRLAMTGDVPRLIEWVRENLGASPFYGAVPIHEQKFCWHVMGSHTARYASLCAMWAEASGDASYAERAIRSFNWATYMASDDGTVTVGIDRPDYYNQCWFTDGYFDYVPHFIDGMAAMPETAPCDSDHLLRSTSVVQEIVYAPLRIRYRTFDARASQVLRLTFKPMRVLADGIELRQVKTLFEEPGWSFAPVLNVVRVRYIGKNVEILG